MQTAASVQRIRVFFSRSCLHFVFWKMFSAARSVFIHANACGVGRTTWAMQHMTRYNKIQAWEFFWIWNFSTHYPVIVCFCSWFPVALQDYQNMSVQKATLLKLNNLNVGNRTSQILLCVLFQLTP